jgi:proteic killer suppression protein
VQNAQKLQLRLQQIEAAARVSDLVAGRPHALSGDRAGQFALDLSGGWRLVFSAADEPQPVRPDGGLDWAQVTIVCIEYIGDYHD